MTGQLLLIIGPLLYPSANGITLSRLLLSALFIMGIFVGIYFEQRELKRSMGEKDYANYLSVIPNLLIPDVAVLCNANISELNEMRRKVINEKTE